MQNEVFNRKLFQRKDGARTRLNQLARADQPSGILASSQPLIDEAMKSVRRPETSAIPMDVAKGMSAGRADGMPMAPAPMPMPMAPPPAPAPMPMAPPPQQMAQAPQPQPNLNPMRPGVRTMQEGGETTPMGPLESGEEAIARNMSDIDISDLAGTVLQAIGIIDDPDVNPKDTAKSLVAMAEGDPDARDIKPELARAAKKLNMSKVNTKQSIPKILKQVRGDLGKMAESTEFFGMAADKDPRAASAFGRAMSKAQGTQMALEADKQKTALANAEAERLLRLKAALTPRTAASSRFGKELPMNRAIIEAAGKLLAAGAAGDMEEAMQMASESISPLYATAAAPASGGAPSKPQTNEQVLAQAQELISSGEASPSDIKEGLIRNGFPEVAEMI